jgi:hypothetical protein
VNNNLGFFLLFTKEGIKKLLETLGIDIDDIDPKDLEDLIRFIGIIIKSMGLDIFSATGLLLLVILIAAILAYHLGDGDRKTIELDLAVIRIKIGNLFYKAIIDLNDPTGLRLKTLYAWNENLRGQFVYCPELSFPRIYCIYSSNHPIPGTDNIRLVCDILAYDHEYQDYHISSRFPAPSRILWWALNNSYNLKITTGYGEYSREISPNQLNVVNIEVLGLRDIFLADNRVSAPLF